MRQNPNPRITISFIAFFSAVLLMTSPGVGDDNWPRFRGHNGSGISKATTIPVEWTEKDYNWKISLPGSGNSSPVVWENHIYVTSADVTNGTQTLQCINAHTGTVSWAKEFEFKKYKTHNNNSFASNTPVVDKDGVCVLWQTPAGSPLIAYSHAGEKQWTYDLGPYKHGQGGATSPIIYQDKVVVSNDGKSNSFLVAVHRKTGDELWKIPRLGKRACFSTPCVFRPEHGPEELIFTHCFEGVIGVDPKTGSQKWHIDVFGTHSQRAVGSPVIYDDLIISSSGARFGEKNVVAVTTVPDKNAMNDQAVIAEEVYRLTKTAPHVPTVIAYEDRLYLWGDEGVVTCANAKTGKTVWLHRAGGNYFASPIIVDGKMYNVDVDGTVVVMSTGDQPRVLARNELGEQCRATPAVANGVLFLRTDSQLFSIGGP